MIFSPEQNVNNDLVNRLEKALEKLNSDYKNSLLDFFTKRERSQWRFIDAHSLDQLQQQLNCGLNELTLALLPIAAAYAETPISKFNVGAIVIDEHGDLYFGANFEFTHTHMAQTIHAEQSAISHAWMSGAGALKLLVVNYPPCGHCRQFINETKRSADFQIQLPQRKAQSFDYYLPESFGPDDLDIDARILQTPEALDPLKHKALEQHDELLNRAYEAYRLSHSPYSHSESGIAIEYEDGEIVTGSYAENAAFNPSLPPLQVALNYRRMLCKPWQVGIKRAYLVEKDSQLSQRENTQQLLSAFSDCVLQYQCID